MDNKKIGLWKTISKNGVNYYKGSIKIGEKKINIRLFKNVKKSEKSPDLSLCGIDEIENAIREELSNNKFKSTTNNIYTEEITDDDFPFD